MKKIALCLAVVTVLLSACKSTDSSMRSTYGPGGLRYYSPEAPALSPDPTIPMSNVPIAPEPEAAAPPISSPTPAPAGEVEPAVSAGTETPAPPAPTPPRPDPPVPTTPRRVAPTPPRAETPVPTTPRRAAPVRPAPQATAPVPVAPPVTLLDPVMSESDSVDLTKAKEEAPLEVAASTNREVKIFFPGEGWYIGSSGGPRMPYLRKEYTQTGSTGFVFRPDQAGTYRVEFARLGASGLEKKSANVTVTDAAPLPLTPVPTPEPVAPSAPVVAPSTGAGNDAPSTSGLAGAANANIVKPALPEAETPAGSAAPIDPVKMRADAGEMDKSDLKKAFETIIAAAGNENLAAYLSDTYAMRFPNDESSAKMYYDLAQSLEKPGAARDLRKAYGYYKKVYELYPISDYSRPAKARLDYLDRFYFKIP